jgi:UPF0755 protein
MDMETKDKATKTIESMKQHLHDEMHNPKLEALLEKERKNKPFRVYSLIGLLLFLCVFCFGAAYYVPNVFLPSAKVYVDVQENMTAGEIAQALKDKGIITSTLWFRTAAALSGQADNMKQGEYIVTSGMSMHDLLAKLVSGESEAARLVVPEGYTVRRIAKDLDKQGLVKEDDFLNAAKNNKNLYAYMKGNRTVTFPTEGFLFPDTYFIPQGATAEQIVKLMLDNFDAHLTADMKQKIAARNMSIYQFVTLASLVEKEAAYDKDRPIIAAVFLKRLAINMPLQSDASISYALGTYKASYSIEETKSDSPYNTYLYSGLPPGPIGNPGMDSLRAVADAPATNYLFFVADAQGHNHFAATYEEHMKNVKEYMP